MFLQNNSTLIIGNCLILHTTLEIKGNGEMNEANQLEVEREAKKNSPC